MKMRDGTRLSCLWPIKKIGASAIRLGSPARLPRSPPPTPAAPVDHVLPPYAGEESWGRRRIMVTVMAEGGNGALEWALSHLIHSLNDSIVLLAVVEPTRCCEKCVRERNARRYQMLYAMQNMCHAIRPEIKVEISLVEGRERGPAIVTEARKRTASLLVLGQKNAKSISWGSLAACAGHGVGIGGSGSVVDYCIQNAPCMTLAVRRKSKRGGGGYLITTKHHKNFWLLA